MIKNYCSNCSNNANKQVTTHTIAEEICQISKTFNKNSSDFEIIVYCEVCNIINQSESFKGNN